MKLKKLYTLSQFVDLVKSLDLTSFKRLFLIYTYTDFLKQPNKKEMSVNELEIPLEMYYRPDEGVQKYPQECYLEDKETFEQAGKRVIFKNVKTGGRNFATISSKLHRAYYGETLHELAEKTSGELELQNVEL